ncbi:hypothetical protein A3A71_03260 [Candidatus Berkelbacteria bacterium RIFCSPLOWO2_01_FULL_50_28]|uniref:Recombinase domain-containing protein n=1 Tax=Candidatus Berkelbacteria bacterium RIFCSPLOWO2_01_FULL_50_28 TaxID=1797471 RepID=A0A1F5ECD4_9BACT|nr:MAG: hypothetical protein A2807_02825 [Candidatus Berkelbacteria bacterium RIFCSPHIGHO2_01_FULL_50_36]OGD63806.1 MAG: hypothetical protein A3F39_03660 [Candidatus Berkelbacteria bacterium RIFCSPHIGHO2_12_FULL_50_11]OGD65079.1 MAG: hypothetical protein A3A71_03260 [Candidatus Berkelbacteria bacterium RIFCSPLOWO2_01_FULL_50_28]
MSKANHSDLTAFYQHISEMGRLEVARRRVQGETIGQPPLGFRKVQVNGKTTNAPDPETFPLLVLALQMRKEGSTLREICSVMSKKGLQSKRGNPIQPNGMHKILKTFIRLIGEAFVDTTSFDSISSQAELSKAA